MPAGPLASAVMLAVQDHIAACRRAFWHWDDGSVPGRPCSCGDCPPDPAVAPYDDCDTCVARESVCAMVTFLGAPWEIPQQRVNGVALDV